MPIIDSNFAAPAPLGGRGQLMPMPVYAAPGGAGDGVELFRKLWRRKGLVIWMMVLCAVAAMVASMMLTPRYRAESRILVGLETPKVASMEAVLRSMIAGQEAVQSEGFVMESRSVAEHVVNRLALDQDPEFNAEIRTVPVWRSYARAAKNFVFRDVPDYLMRVTGLAPETEAPAAPRFTDEEWAKLEKEGVVNALLDATEVVPMRRSHVLSISVQSERPESAARIANAFADVYIEQRLIRQTSAARQATGWLDKQVVDLRQQVDESERAVEEYRRKNGLYVTKSEMLTSQQLNELNTQLILAQSEKAAAESRLSQAEKVMRGGSVDGLPEVVNSPLYGTLRAREIEVDRMAAELSSVYGPDHPKIKDIKAQQREVRAATRGEVGKVITSLRHQTDAARARYAELQGQLGSAQKSMGETNEKAIKLRELERQAEANRNLLRNFLDRSKETGAQEGMKEPDATVISRASMPWTPSFPPRTTIVMLGLIGGGLLGSIIALMIESLDRTFRTTDQVEQAMRLPTIGMIPAIGMHARVAKFALRYPDSAFSESVRNMYTRLFIAAGSNPPKVVMVTSAAPHEGKSRLAITMASLMAYTGRRVVVVDCDWKRPVQHTFHGRPMRPGLADLLSGNATPEQAVHRDASSGAHVIFAGNVARMESEPGRFDELRHLLQTLAKHYDLVIVDAPPVLAGAEALPLLRMVDRVLFLVKWGATPREVALNGLKQVYAVGGRVAGVVLTQVDPKRYRRYGMGEIVYPYRRAHIVGVG